jgi:hypothetical protein
MTKEKLRSRLNLKGTPHVAVTYALFVDLQLWVVVVSLPLLAVYEVSWADFITHAREREREIYYNRQTLLE